MDIKDIEERARVSMEAIKQMKVQEKVFEDTIELALKSAPEEAKKDINRFKNLMMEVKRLTTEGKLAEAEELIKTFDYVGKNNK